MEGKQITYLGLQQVVHGTRTVCAFPWSFMLGCCKEKKREREREREIQREREREREREI